MSLPFLTFQVILRPFTQQNTTRQNKTNPPPPKKKQNKNKNKTKQKTKQNKKTQQTNKQTNKQKTQQKQSINNIVFFAATLFVGWLILFNVLILPKLSKKHRNYESSIQQR